MKSLRIVTFSFLYPIGVFSNGDQLYSIRLYPIGLIAMDAILQAMDATLQAMDATYLNSRCLWKNSFQQLFFTNRKSRSRPMVRDTTRAAKSHSPKPTRD